MREDLVIEEVKKVLVNLWDNSESSIEKFFQKLKVIQDMPEIETVVLDIMEFVNNFDKVAINLIGADENIAYYLIDRFSKDERITFFVDNNKEICNLSTLEASVLRLNGTDGELLDYTTPLILSDVQSQNRVYFIDGGADKEVNIEKNEKRLCKIVSDAIKKDKTIGVSTYDKDSLIYLKGLLKGAAAANTKVEFVVDVVRQQEVLEKMRSELYSVLPMFNFEKSRSMYELKKKVLTGINNFKWN